MPKRRFTRLQPALMTWGIAVSSILISGGPALAGKIIGNG